MFYRSLPALALVLTLAACKTTAPEAGPVTIITPEFKTCTEMSALERIEVPAVTETFYGITEIENPPYEPIQRREEIIREIEPAKVIFVDSQGREVTDICEPEFAPGAKPAGTMGQ